MQNDPFKEYKQGDKVSAGDLNNVRNVLAKLARSAPATGVTDATGNISSRRRPFDPQHKAYLWKVVSVATGAEQKDSVYICSHQLVSDFDSQIYTMPGLTSPGVQRQEHHSMRFRGGSPAHIGEAAT